MEKKNIAYKLLANARIYSAFQRIVRGKEPKIYLLIKKICKEFYSNHGRNPILLDLGCGEGELCNWIYEDCKYYGVDYSEKYLSHASKKFKDKGEFMKINLSSRDHCAELSKNWDIIIGIGVMHHLANDDVLNIKQYIMDANPNAIVLTIDPVLLEKQNFIAKFIVSRDRGSYVRTLVKYQELMQDYNYHLDNFSRIPYNHILFHRNVNLITHLDGISLLKA